VEDLTGDGEISSEFWNRPQKPKTKSHKHIQDSGSIASSTCNLSINECVISASPESELVLNLDVRYYFLYVRGINADFRHAVLLPTR
jgi:hypothetical protein